MKKKNTIPSEVEINYIKNPLYRQIHVDGAIGGVTTKGKINLNFYGERITIPKTEEYQVSPDGKLDGLPKISKDSKSGIIREIELGVYLDLDTANELKKWLEFKIQELELLTKKPNTK